MKLLPRFPASFKLAAVFVACTLALFCVLAQEEEEEAATRVGFYFYSCPDLEWIVESTVTAYIESDVTIAAGLLRLHFHDCFVQGCDGSILIDGPTAEKSALANLGLRGFEVIDDAKAKIEGKCPGVVSCADILALAARDAVDQSGGPRWEVPLGRRDGRVSSASDAANMPSPLDSISVLKQKFAAKGLSSYDLSILTGAHTIGQTECRFFSYRLYNYSASGQPDPSISPDYLQTLQQLCPQNGDGLKKVALDSGSQTRFDTNFYTNVRQGKGVLESDQRLMSDSFTANQVRSYSGLVGGILGLSGFYADFADSMIKMGNIEVKSGTQGEIRKVCSAFN